MERLYRDARILPIYEGTTEIQVGSSIQALLAGGLETVLDELGASGEGRDLLQRSLAAISKRGDKHFTQLFARPAVDTACELVMGRLLRRPLAAEKWMRDRLPFMRARVELVEAGDTTVIDHPEALL